ncbi:MAG: hypothetical protein JW981_00730 [Anaerolineae bacterium]|nr:hypothetical protein [Anaerolineae bacterium]
MFKKIENLAWMVLLLAFMTFLIIIIGTPLSIRWYILNSTRDLDVRVEKRAGTVGVQENGRGAPVIISGEQEVKIKSHIIGSTSDAEAWLEFYSPESPDVPIMTVQIYGATHIAVESTSTPRFASSELPHQAVLQLQSGPNIRFAVMGDENRSAHLNVKTPQGDLELEEGTYALSVTADQTQITVRTGQARIPNKGSGENEKLVLTELQRTELTAAGVGEIATGERDVLRNRNGSFDTQINGNWKTYALAALTDEDSGTVRQATTGNKQTTSVLFERVGQGHAETGIEQEINQDVRGAESLSVRARLKVDLQLLPVCGSLGTECPLMLRIKYTDDQSGDTHEWLQGFYTGDSSSSDPAYCAICEWKAEHIQIPKGIWYDYESPDLLPLLQAEGIRPATIQSIAVYASGHTYVAAIDEIAVLIGE